MTKQNVSPMVSAITSTAKVSADVVMSAKTRSAIVNFVTLDQKQDTNLRTISEGMHADGFTGFMLMTLNNGGIESAREQTIGAILAGFSKPDFALYHKDAKTLDAEAKQNRTNLRTKKDTYLNRIRTHLFALSSLDSKGNVPTEAVAEEDTTEDIESTKTENQKIHAALASVVAKLQKMDTPNFDVADCIKRIMSAQGMIPLN